MSHGTWETGDKRLQWPYSFHSKVARNEPVTNGDILHVMDNLQKQNHYARQLQATCGSLIEENRVLKAENVFLTEQINQQGE
jgi:hypothetical protein